MVGRTVFKDFIKLLIIPVSISEGEEIYSKLQRFLNLKSATVPGGNFYSPDIKNVV